MPFLIKRFYDKAPTLYMKRNGIYSSAKCNFDDYFKAKSMRFHHSMIDVFFDVFSELTNYGHDTNELYRKGLRKWRYFVKNNVKIKTIKPGDNVEFFYNFLDHEVKNGIVKTVYIETGIAIVKDSETNTDKSVNMYMINKVNGEPLSYDYYIKYKNKTYGIN